MVGKGLPIVLVLVCIPLSALIGGILTREGKSLSRLVARHYRVVVTGVWLGVVVAGYVNSRAATVLSGAVVSAWYLAGEPSGVPAYAVRDVRAALPYILVATSHSVFSPNREMTSLRELALVTAPDGTREVVAKELRGLGSPAEEFVHERDWFEPYAGGRCDIDVTGRIAFAPLRDRWLVCLRNRDGSGVCLARAWKATIRTEQEIAAAMAIDDGPRESILDGQPAIGRIRWRPDGMLWVEPGGVAPADDALACFDEVSADGQLQRRVQVKSSEGMPGDELLLLEDGRFVVLRGFKAADENPGALRPEVILLKERGLESD